MFAGATALYAASPRERIETLNATLLHVMQNADTLGYTGRYEKLQPVMESLYDFALMARVAAGGLLEGSRGR